MTCLHFKKEKKKNFPFFQSVGCGNYGPVGSFPNFDFLNIPMASADGTATLAKATSNFCGGGLVVSQSLTATSASMAINQVTICSKYQK